MGVAWMSQYEADKLGGGSKKAVVQAVTSVPSIRITVAKPAKPNRK